MPVAVREVILTYFSHKIRVANPAVGLEWAGLLTVSYRATMSAVPVAAVITAVRIARVGCTTVPLIAKLSIFRRGLTMND